MEKKYINDNYVECNFIKAVWSCRESEKFKSSTMKNNRTYSAIPDP
jgi:hypothetical protein